MRRIEVLDLLRGVAILGTLGTNIWIFTNPLGPAGVFSGLTSPDLLGQALGLHRAYRAPQRATLLRPAARQ